MKRATSVRLASSAILTMFLSQTAISAGRTESERTQFAKKTLGPAPVGRALMGAGIEQGMGRPREWGGGMVGFARRFANGMGQNIIKKSIEYPVAKLRHEEFGYHVSDKTGTKSRLLYALTAVIITHKTTDGSKTLHAGEISGALGSGLISRLWQPASTRTLAMGFGAAGITLAADAGMNVVREFWPEIRHPHSHDAVRAALLAKRRTLRAGTVEPVIAEEPAALASDERDREDDN